MSHQDMIMICIFTHQPNQEMKKQDAFYEELKQIYDAMPDYCIKLLLGDMNVQEGKGNAYKTTIGKHSLHDLINDNRIRLILQ